MSKIKHVALAIPHSGFGQMILQGIASYVQKAGPWVTWLAQDRQPSFRKWEGDGIITALFSREQYRVTAAARKPMVNVSSSLGDLDAPYVGADNQAIGRMAANHLLEKGYKHFAYFGNSGHYGSINRLHGFNEVILKAGYHCLFCDMTPINMDDDRFLSLRPFKKWVKAFPKPIGIFTFNDGVGLFIANACTLTGIRIPEELALVGTDDSLSVCEMCSPPLSSVHLPWERVGYEAAAMLDRMMNGEKPQKSPILIAPTGVTVRQSSDVLAVEDIEMSSALCFIRQNLGQMIAVAHVANHLGMCRRVLERRFFKAYGHTVAETIRLERMEMAKRELADHHKPISLIVQSCGFRANSHFVQVFRKHLGQTPSQYRKQVLKPAN